LLFAFQFESPLMLIGLAAAAAPVIIHLLNRRRFREMEWAAMRFLLAAIEKNARRMRIEQLLLLLVRTMILVLLALAMARPSWGRFSQLFTGSQPVHRILVLDASLSMQQPSGDATVFSRAKAFAREIVSTSNTGDAFNLVRMSTVGTPVVIQSPSFQADQVLAEIEQLTASDAPAGLTGALESAARLVSGASSLKRKEVYFISDFQRSSWAGDSAEQMARSRDWLRQISDKARIACVDVGEGSTDNAAIIDARLSEPFVLVGRRISVTASVRDFGRPTLSGRKLELYVDGKLADQRTIELNSSGDLAERLTAVFSSGGEHHIEVRLPGTDLAQDNHRWIAVPVRDRIKVLIVGGRRTTRSGIPATDFLRLALSPSEKSSAAWSTTNAAEAPFDVRVVNESQLQETDLDQFDCVFVCNVPQFTQREAELLDGYVRRGGGLVWCLGDQVRIENYNERLYRGGEGVLPARLQDRVGDAGTRTDPFEFDPASYEHPIVGAYAGNPDAGLTSTRTYAYIQARIADGSTTRAALKFSTGDPAICERTVGLGKSILVTTSVDDSWSNWSIWPSFLPLMQETVLFAVSGRWGDRQSIVGEPLTSSVRTGAVDVTVNVRCPDGQTRPGQMTRDRQVSTFSFGETGSAGLYSATYGPPVSLTEGFAVNVDTAESDLQRLTREELQEGVFSGRDFEYLTEWQPGRTGADADSGEGSAGLSRWFLYGVLYLLLAELALAWKFAAGLMVLFPPLLAPAMVRWFRTGQFLPPGA
jgi:hypothetical protein